MDANDIRKMTLAAFKYTNPLTRAVAESIEKNVQKINEVSNNGSVEDLQRMAQKQKIEMQMIELQVKVEQELAIARRIDTAEEVIIEEYFEGTGEGKMGLNAEEGNVSLGLSGEGRRISKRVYTFKGWRDPGLEGFEKIQSTDSEA
ncbi:hypothetical protein [Acetobacterium wieringae]|uniref:hypothetical protein n=1 Tax=Acetobacterium wieringae TaxID=52694 RepID=UPI002B1EF238|nr:hypothetical protein [Acetobacterium wieringae]MEA4807400.1 hypothetical protein [Acetobacterium wieringae]